MFDKIYSKVIWIVVACILVYFLTDNTIFGLIGGILFFVMAAIKVTYDAIHHQLPWQKQQEVLEKEGIKKRYKAVPKRK